MVAINEVFYSSGNVLKEEGWSIDRSCFNTITLATIGLIGGLLLLKTGQFFYSSYRSKPQVTAPSLEETYQNLIFQKFDCKRTVFGDFLSPNESFPEVLKDHLDLISIPGYIVSVGTERSFFDLVLCNPKKCLGLIIRDCNPKVKAYVDFNMMLLRIAQDSKEYAILSEDLLEGEEKSADLRRRTDLIQQKIALSDIPKRAKEYYLENLIDFAEIYFERPKSWRGSDQFAKVQYHKDNKQFATLQTFAKEGKIIATIGDVNDLHFLDGKRIAIVDISNIPDYLLIDLKGDENLHPRVIWTKLDSSLTTYHSYVHMRGPSQKEKIDPILKLWIESKRMNKDLLANQLNFHLDFASSLNIGSFSPYNCRCADYSEYTLSRIREFEEKIPQLAQRARCYRKWEKLLLPEN